MSTVAQLAPLQVVKEFNVNCAQAAGTYDVCLASGDVLIESLSLYCTVVGATFTSLTLQTNSSTAVTILNSTDGAVANLTAGKQIALTIVKQTLPITLRDTLKIRMTLAGSTGTGTLKLQVLYRPITAGASLS